ncbi:MAG: BatA domain-containing protein, partial [Candidatus Poribacteria bacterium]
MNFFNPLLLIGILAVGIPLIIHLWSRRHAKIIDFSSLQFLLSLNRRKVRSLRLKQILILILRMLIILMIVLAFARPILKSRWLSSASGMAKRSVVIILDNSYSMRYSGLQGIRFNLAKEKALEILDSLGNGDNASLILMSDVPEIVFKKVTSNIQQVKNAVQNAKLSYRGTSVLTSLLSAYSLLEEAKNPQKQVYLISDLGENGWKNWKSEISEKVVDIETNIIKIGENADNRAIENVSFSNDIIGTGTPIQINAKVKGTISGQTIAELFIEGEKKSQATVKGNTISFTDVFHKPGIYTGEIRLASDQLPIDDSKFFVFDVIGRIKVLVVGDNKFYVNLALNPYNSLESEAMIYPVNATAEELEKISLDKYNVVLLVDVPRLSDSAVRNLNEFYSNGGNIVIFVGKSADRDWYNKFDLVSVSFVSRNDFTQKPLKISRWNKDHPIFSVFHLEGMSGTLRAPEIYNAFSVIPKTGAEIISSFDNNFPAIIEVKSAKSDINIGKLILFNLSPDPQVSDIHLRPAFLPLVQQTILYLVTNNNIYNKNLLVGERYSRNIYGKIDSIPKIIDPDGNEYLAMLSDSKEDNVKRIS